MIFAFFRAGREIDWHQGFRPAFPSSLSNRSEKRVWDDFRIYSTLRRESTEDGLGETSSGGKAAQAGEGILGGETALPCPAGEAPDAVQLVVHRGAGLALLQEAPAIGIGIGEPHGLGGGGRPPPKTPEK